MAFPSPLPKIVSGVVAIGTLLAPFASLYALWLAKRRGEDDFAFGCLLSASIIASAVVTLLVSLWLILSIWG